MRKFCFGRSGNAALAGIVTFGGLMALSLAASGVEPGKHHAPAALRHEMGVPLLSKIPYISRLFKTVGYAEPVAQDEPAFERIGVDFEACEEVPVVGRVGVFEIQICPGAEAKTGCKDECSEHCTVGSCSAGKCAAGKCAAGAACSCGESCCGDQCTCAGQAHADVHHAATCQCHSRDELWREIVELSAGKAAAEASLEASGEAHEQFADLFESMTELAAENAKLATKLEMHEEHAKLTGQMLELAAENSRLKAQVELAAERTKAAHSALAVSLENELLKQRIAELEKRSAAAEEEVRTAKRAQAGKKAR